MDMEQISIGVENFLKLMKNLYVKGMNIARGNNVQDKQKERFKAWDHIQLKKILICEEDKACFVETVEQKSRGAGKRVPCVGRL